ncbi:MAG: hypothetical protein JW749_08040 [Sedimentisphaerales bacterium]|nr:hypothetical protein [Sedimentisphaerales bacterium]
MSNPVFLMARLYAQSVTKNWQTVDSNYSLDDDNDVDMDDLFLFTKDWLWTDLPIEQVQEEGGESFTTISLEVAPVESTSIEESATESVQETETPLPEQIEMLRNLIDWSEKLWLENEDIRNMVGEEQWLKVMKSLYEELEILEERNEKQPG